MKSLALAFVSGAMMLAGFVGSPLAQDPTPAKIKGGILNGKAVSLPKPDYPAEARSAGLQGTVFIDVEIDEEGTVVSAVASTEPRKMIRSKGEDTVEMEVPLADPILREAAERAAMQARFSPTRLGGNPVRVNGTIVYNFVSADPTSGVRFSAGDVLNSTAVDLPIPTYPPAAMAIRAEGTVAVEVTIDENGSVISASAVSGHPLLRLSAVKAARDARFPSAAERGVSGKVRGILTYTFSGPTKEN